MRPIPDLPGYFATPAGRIYSAISGRYLTPHLVGKGYFAVSVVVNGKKRNPYVHRLVALTFVSNPEGKPHVNHIDGDKANNTPSNLEWVTPRENNKHATDSGLAPRHGMKNANAKLFDDAVIRIRHMIAQGMNNTEIARIVGIERSTISRIRHNRRWAHVQREDADREQLGRIYG